MIGIRFGGNSEIDFLEVPDPTPGPGEVVLEMKASGMCGSDLKLFRAPPGTVSAARVINTEPIIAGHEPCGVVAAIGPGVSPEEARIGARVMVHHYWGCSVCDHCRSGWAQMCSHSLPRVYGVNAHGGHAPYLKVPARTLVPLPDELSFEAGAAISCGTGTAYSGLRKINTSGNDTIAIFGQGPVGLAAAQLAAAMGARVIALDTNPKRLELSPAFGASHVVNPAAEDAVAAIRELTKGRGADLVLETSASPAARAASIQCTRPWGSICLVGTGGKMTVDNVSDITRNQLTIVGSWTFSNVGQAECTRFIAERAIPVDKVFTHRWQLAQAQQAYEVFGEQNAGKGVFVM
ncbi:MAG: zinc-binding dehydrogenase [Pseudomonadota bacterium]